MATASPNSGSTGDAGPEAAPDTSDPSTTLATSPTGTPPITPDEATSLLANTPRAFTENRGQVEDHVRFYAQGGGLWFTNDGVWFDIREEVEKAEGEGGCAADGFENHQRASPFDLEQEPKPVQRRGVVLKQEFVGCNEVEPVGVEDAGWDSNFFYGNVPEKWCTEVPNWEEVWYHDLWDGIDLRYYTNGDGLKYDFIVQPGVDVGNIRVTWEGALEVLVDDNGELAISTGLEVMRDGGLDIYQNRDGNKHTVEGEFVLHGSLQYGFQISGSYDHNVDLVIDPYLECSTFVGGSSKDYGKGISTDSAGNAFITGYTESNDFPTTPGSYDTQFNAVTDIYISKLNQDGSSLLYSTFVGGAQGLCNDWGDAIAVDPAGNAYVTGMTNSADFPTTPGAFDQTYIDGEAYVLKLAPGGTSLVFSTLLGGDIRDSGRAIEVDPEGRAIVAGQTSSTDFPTTSGAFDTTSNGDFDVFVAMIGKDGKSLVSSTHIGGGGYDDALSIAVDPSGNVFITGSTNSSDFPITPNAINKTYSGAWRDGYVVKIMHDFSLLGYCTYLTSAACYGIDVDLSGCAYVTGGAGPSFTTIPGAFDTTPSPNGDIFVCKINSGGSDFVYSTFIGANSYDIGSAIVLDSLGEAFITGYTYSTDFPITPGAYDTSNNDMDAFLLKLSGDGSNLLYASYIGGTGSEWGHAIAMGPSSDLYITGQTHSMDFYTKEGAYDNTFNGDIDAFVMVHSLGMTVTSFELLQDGAPATDLYSRLCPYTFRVKVRDSLGPDDLYNVSLTLDPYGADIQLVWDHSTDEFSERSDPLGYVDVDQSSDTQLNANDEWRIDFEVIFNWNYPDEDLHRAWANATGNIAISTGVAVSDMYWVENDLEFSGELSVTGEDNSEIEEMSIVRGGEMLTWFGLKMVYEGSIDLYPPTGECGVAVWDQDGNFSSWSNKEGEEFYIKMTALSRTDVQGHEYRVNITDIPPECDKTDVTYTICIDADNVTFTNPTPDNATWQNGSMIPVTVTILDTGGALVYGETVEFTSSSNNGTSWDPWLPAPAPTATTIEATTFATLPDGRENLVKWQAFDTLGNGPAESPAYRVLVDTAPPEFSNCHPPDAEVSNSQLNLVGIDIHDETSGVNDSTIEYCISTDGGTTWGVWTSVAGVRDGRYTHCEVDVTFPDGYQNRVKWRAKDIAGNSAESGAYIVNIDVWKDLPKVELLSPLDEVVLMEDREIRLSWQLAEGSPTASSFSVYMGYPGSFNDLLINGTTNTSYILGDIEPGLYAWTVLPISSDGREGLCLSGNWTFTVEHCPCLDYAVEVDPIAPVEMFAGDVRTIEVTVWNHGLYYDVLMFSLDSGELGNRVYISNHTQAIVNSGTSIAVGVTVSLENKDMPADDYTLTFTAVSKGALENGWEVEDNESFVVTFPSEPYDPGPGDGGGDGNGTDGGEGSGDITTWAIVITVLVIVGVVGFMLYMSIRKKKMQEPVDPGGEIDTVDIEQPGEPALSGPVCVMPIEAVDVEADVKGPDGHVPLLTATKEAEASTRAPNQPTPVAAPGAVAPVPVARGGVIGGPEGVERLPPAKE